MSIRLRYAGAPPIDGRMSAEEYRASVKANKRRKEGAHRIIATPLDGEPVRYGRLSLAMPPLSVNNLFANGKHGRFSTKLYTAWQTMALIQLRRQGGWHVPGIVRVRLQFTRQQTRADLDNLAKPVLDVLVKAGRISDDRNVGELRLLFSDRVTGTQIDIWEQQLSMDNEPPRKGCAPVSAAVADASQDPKAAAPAPHSNPLSNLLPVEPMAESTSHD